MSGLDESYGIDGLVRNTADMVQLTLTPGSFEFLYRIYFHV